MPALLGVSFDTLEQTTVLWLVLAVAACAVAALAVAGLRRAPRRDEQAAAAAVRPRRVAVLIASKDGSGSIAETIRSVRDQADVFVVSDGSTDRTATIAEEAGAHVHELAENVGKPTALHRALHHFQLFDAYDHIAVLDDDTTVAPDFVERCLSHFAEGVAIVCGKTLSAWPRERAWNLLVGSRMYSYWKFQLTIKRGQSAVNAVNCVAGSNSVYRADLLKRVVLERTPYIVDDCFWAHETQRHRLGRIVYAADAVAWVQDPTSVRDWWRQNTRWLWGTFQAMWGHAVMRRVTWFDFWYVVLVLEWLVFVLGGPVVVALLVVTGIADPLVFIGVYFAGYIAWAAMAAVATRKWRLLVMAPAFPVIDWLYRAVFVFAIYKTVRQPTVDACRWQSPQRYDDRSVAHEPA